MGDTRNEPSMDHILASIKRIITDEGSAALSARARAQPKPPEPAPPERADDDVLELTHPVEEPTADPAPAEQPAAPVIVSANAASASRQSLAALSAMVVRHDPEQGNTLESLVRELLRPMLKDWLDARLPDLVEELVAREIARITGKAL